MNSRLRWLRDKPETGLARITAHSLSSKLHDGTTRFAVVSPIGGFRRNPGGWYLVAGWNPGGWYWVAGWESNVPHRTTIDAPCKTQDEAKRHALAYVKLHLSNKGVAT